MDIDEAVVWQRALAGEGAAFGELFRKHQGRVYRRALTVVGDVHSAEDVTSVAFFELWRKRRSVRLVNDSVLPWLLVTTLNLARNQRRGSVRYRDLIASLPRQESPDAESIALANSETRLLGVRLSEAMSRLNRADVALLVLTVLDDMSTADAAAALGIRPGAARMRLSRARERLRGDLADTHPSRHALIEGESA